MASGPTHPPQVSDPARFEKAVARFDQENDHDPIKETLNGVLAGRERVYSQWLAQWVQRLDPEASEQLRLAARCQHLCRWKIPRASYPMTRAGYLKWRSDLKHFHATKAAEILKEVGYPEELIAQVRDLNLKKNLGRDRDCQTLEDALCLVFIEHQLAALAGKTTEEKVINALQKSWRKMSPAAAVIAQGLDLPPRERALIEKALAMPT